MMICFLSVAAQAQESDGDSTATSNSTQVIQKPTKTDKPKEPKKEGFGESLVSMGKGFLQRLKYRFNLEAVEKKVGKTQDKFKKKDEKKGGS